VHDLDEGFDLCLELPAQVRATICRGSPASSSSFMSE
jgi:hypothetical protein